VTARLNLEPGAPPMQSTGTATSRMILGGRFLVSELKTSGGPLAIEGMTILGFDRRAKQYTWVGYDNFGTYYVTGAGTWDEAARTITYSGESRDPLTGRTEVYDFVTRHEGPDRYTLEVIFKLPDGSRFKAVEAVYTRRR
jgi:hypothetical protein